jgi:hypothetical protein
VLAHLRSCADARGDFIWAILAEDRPTLRAINPTTWIKQTDYRELEFAPSFRSFSRQRARLLRLLRSLPEKKLVTYRDRDRGWAGTRADGAVICAVGRSP